MVSKWLEKWQLSWGGSATSPEQNVKQKYVPNSNCSHFINPMVRIFFFLTQIQFKDAWLQFTAETPIALFILGYLSFLPSDFSFADANSLPSNTKNVCIMNEELC